MKQLTLALGLLGLLAYEAQAHTALTESVPGDAAVVTEPPKELVLTFSTEVRLTALTIQGSGEEPRDLASLPNETAQEIVIAIDEDLAPGDYLITWRAVGADTHVVSGEIHFTVSQPSLSSRAPTVL